jgi:quinol monooxygenase YgiN
MRADLAMMITGTMLAATVPSAALAQAPAGASYAVTYIEVAPSAAAKTIGLLKELAAASHKEAGNQRYEILERIERKNHFAILEAWSDFAAADAHRKSDAMKQFRDKLTALRVGPYDERPSMAVDVASSAPPSAKGSIYVITHVDVAPNFKDQCSEMLKSIADATRKEPNAERVEAWVQNNRANHFTLMEVWKNAAAVDTHLVAAGTKEFREKLGPLSGALYDERHYTNLE